MPNPMNPNVKLIREAVTNPLTPRAVERILREKSPPDSVEAPLTTTNSIVIHLTARVTFLEAQLAKVLSLLEPDESEGAASVPASAAEAAAQESVDEDAPVTVNTSRVVNGAVMPGPGGAVAGGESGPVRQADATPFPAGVATSAPPGTGQRVTVTPSGK